MGGTKGAEPVAKGAEPVAKGAEPGGRSAAAGTAAVDAKVFEEDDEDDDEDGGGAEAGAAAAAGPAAGADAPPEKPPEPELSEEEKRAREQDIREVRAILRRRELRDRRREEDRPRFDFTFGDDDRMRLGGRRESYRLSNEAMRRLDDVAAKTLRKIMPRGFMYSEWQDATTGGRHSDDLRFLAPNDSRWAAGAIGAPVAIGRTTEEEDERLWSRLNAVRGAQNSISVAMERVAQTIRNDIPYFPRTKTPENEDPFWKASDPESQAIALEQADAAQSFDARNLRRTCVAVAGRSFTPYGSMSVRWEPGHRLVVDYVLKDRTKVDPDGRLKETRIPICMLRDEHLCKSFFGLFIGPDALDAASKRKLGRAVMRVLNGRAAAASADNVQLTGVLPLSFGVFSLTDAAGARAAGEDDDGEFNEREFVLNGILRAKLKSEE